VTEAGRANEPLRKQISDFLRRAGAKLVDLPKLPAAERNCQEGSCLNRIAERHRAQLLLAARIDRRSARDRDIYMWIYDAHSGSDQSERVVCDSINLEEKLREMAGKLVGPYLGDSEKDAPAVASQAVTTPAAPIPAAPIPAAPMPAEPTPAEPMPAESAKPPEVAPPDAQPAVRLLPKAAAAVTVQLQPDKVLGPKPQPRSPVRQALSSWRNRIALGLGILSLGALATAIPLHAVTGMKANTDGLGPPEQYVYNYQPLFIPMYAAAGALAVGTAITLFLPSKKEAKK
jgi:hypothetical protein